MNQPLYVQTAPQRASGPIPGYAEGVFFDGEGPLEQSPAHVGTNEFRGGNPSSRRVAMKSPFLYLS